jgi:hypothetical protein
MPLLEEFVHDCIKHYQTVGYDPAERRERYLRERELLGRKPTAVKKPLPKRSTSKTSQKISTLPSTKKLIPKKDPAQRRKEVEAKVEELKGRLARLKEILAQLVEQAKARSGVKESDNKDEKTSTRRSSTSKLTDKQKADKAKAQQDYYEKHKDEILDKQVKTLDSQIKSVAQKIKDMREKLAAPAVRPVNRTRL